MSDSNSPWLDAPTVADVQATQRAVNARQPGTPDQAASAARLSRETGIPADVALRNPEQVQQRATATQVEQASSRAPWLAARMAEPGFHAVAKDDARALADVEQGYGETVGNAAGRGWQGLKQSVYATAASSNATMLRQLDAIEAAEREGKPYMGQDNVGATQMTQAQRDEYRASLIHGIGTQAVALATQEVEKRKLPAPAVVGRIQRADGFGAAVREFATDPARAVLAVGTESAVANAPGLVLGAVTPGGLGARAAVAGVGSYTADFGAGILEALREQGVDTTDPAAVEAAVRNPAIMNRAVAKASAHAAVVGSLDAVSAGIAGKLVVPAIKGAAAREVANVAAQVPVQGALGGAGEALGQVAAGAQNVSWGDVLLEVVGEGFTAPIEVGAIAGREVRGRYIAARAAEADAQRIAELARIADGSRLKARDPETFAEFVRGLDPDGVVYIAPEHLQGIALPASLTDPVRVAAETGGDVAVPVADLLAHLPGEKLAPHLRMTPEAPTATEAQSHDVGADLAHTVETIGAAPAGFGMLREKPDGMDEAAWSEYQTEAAAAAQAAIEARERRSMRDMQWLANAKSAALKALHKAASVARAAVGAEVAAEVEKRPAFAVQTWLKTGRLPDGTQTVGAKLSTAALRAMFGDGPAAPWRYISTDMLAAEGGMHPDVVAEMFGFPSGDAMVRAIVGAGKLADAIEGATDARMIERHPDLVDQIRVERAAEEAIAERARLRFLATEAAALRGAIGNRTELAAKARRYAEQVSARMTLREARPAQFKAAADRAGRNADAAFAKGDTARAAKYKHAQVLQTALHRAATELQSEVESALAAFKRIASGRHDGQRDGNLADAARSILTRFGLADRVKGDPLAKVAQYDPDLHADLLALLDGLPEPVADHRDLSAAEFLTVRDKVAAIWSLAKSTRELEIDGEQVQIDDAAQALADQLAGEKQLPADKAAGRNDKLQARFLLSGLRAGLRRVEHWASARDRGANGPFTRYVWQPISEAVTRYRAVKAERVAEFLALLEPIKGTLLPGRIDAPELGTGAHLADRSALLHALLHTGNESNKRKLLLGYGWATENEAGEVDTSRWDAFLARMHTEGRITEADWAFVQGVWDLNEKSKPAAQRAHKRMFGHYFDEVTAEPVQTPWGTLRGGYVPAITDRLKVAESRQHGAMDDLLAGQASPMFPAVGRGFTKARVEYNAPLALDLRSIPAHLDAVAKFSELGPALRDTARLVSRNKKFTRAMAAVDPTAVESLLVPWLKRTAQQSLTKPPEGWSGRAVASIAGPLRNRTGLLLMAGNVVNTMQQFTGFSVALLKVKPAHLAAGLWQMVSAPKASADAINELSPWMAQRADNGAHDLEATIDKIVTNPGLLARGEALGSRYGYILQQAAQNIVDRITWLGMYRQAQAAGIDGKEAVRAADAAVRQTQGSFAPEDSAAVEHQTAFVRLFLQFYSYFSAQGNLLATEASNAKGNPARLALVYLLGFAVPAVLSDAIGQAMRGGDDDDDDALDWALQTFFLSQARYALAMLPVAGQVGNAIIGQATPERFDDRVSASPAFSAIEGAIRAPRSIYRWATDDGSARTAVRDGLAAVQLMTGLPAGALARPAGYLADEDRDGVSVRGLVTGAKQ